MSNRLRILPLDDNPNEWARRYQQLINTLPLGVYRSTVEGEWLELNPAALRLFGFASLEEATTQRLREPYADPADRERFRQQLLTQGQVAGWRVRMRRTDGSIFWAELHATLVRDENDQPRFIDTIVEDFTERQRAEEALSQLPEQTSQPVGELNVERMYHQILQQVHQAEARYRDLYENAPDGYDAVDAEGVIREMNATQLNWLGYSPEEVIDQMRFKHLLTPEGRRKFSQRLDRCKREGHLENVELDLVCKGGRLLPVRVNMAVVRDAEGQYMGYRATARDITKERALEAQLLQAQKLESLGTLVGGIAHDFNNMLTGILGYTQLLLRQMEPEDKLYEGLQRVELLSERAADMVRQLLAFSRQDVSQKIGLSLHPFVKEISKLLERMIPENIEIDLRLAPEDLRVEADPTQLQQVLMNLAVNARDAMSEGGRLGIETAPVQLDETFCQAHPDTQPGRYVRLSVSDTGIGIPPEIRSRIFDPFFTTKEAGKGTGLGLPVVYGIVKKHGGAIEVESQVGRGTTMQVYLPLTEKPVLEAGPRFVEVLKGTETILLVEDDPLVVELGQTALRYFGYRVLTARNGVEAIRVYQEHPGEIALVLLDLVMPKMGGRETFRALKGLDPRARVLLATAYGSGHVTARTLLEEGALGLVRKPYQIHELARTVRATLNHS